MAKQSKFKARKKSKAQEEADERARMAAHEQPSEPVAESPALTTEVPDASGDVQDVQVPEQASAEPASSEAAGESQEEEVKSDDEKVVHSVVKDKYKDRYKENAKVLGVGGKAAKRSNWDWLAQEIAGECLGEKDKINMQAFMDLLERNGVDYSKWANRNKGWEGRFRMTGRVALQRVVAEKNVLKKAMSDSVPPTAWLAKFKKTESAAA